MSEARKVSRGAAIAGLLGTTVLWGTSFAAIKECGAILTGAAAPGTSAAFGPLLLSAVRFTVASLLILVFWKEARACWPRRGDWGPLLQVSAVMSTGFLVQAAGLAWTTATISAFLTNLTVCLTPVLEWLILRRRTSWRLALAVALAVGAVVLITVSKPQEADGGAAWGFGIGELLTLICAVAFAFQILWTGVAAERAGAAQLTLWSFAALAAAGWVVVLVAWPGQVAVALLAAAASVKFWALFAVLLFCATIGAMVLMNVYQQYVRPTEAAVIYTGEPIFGGLFAWMVRGDKEALGPLGFLGAALMIAADLLAAIRMGERKEPGLEPPPAANQGPEK